MAGGKDIFQRQAPSKIDRHAAEKVKLQLGLNDVMYVQQISWQYAQRVSRIFDLSDPERMLYVAARPEGSLTLVHLVTSPKGFTNVLKEYGDVCKDTKVITVTLPDGNCAANGGNNGGNGKFVFNNPVVSAIGISLAISDYLITDNLQFMFSYLADQ